MSAHVCVCSCVCLCVVCICMHVGICVCYGCMDMFLLGKWDELVFG